MSFILGHQLGCHYGLKHYCKLPRARHLPGDLVRKLLSEGWDESKGFPDVVLMKWSGTDAERANASQRVFDEDFKGFGSGEAGGLVAAARSASRSSSIPAAGSKASGSNIGRGDTGTVRAGSGSPKPNGVRGAASKMKQLISIFMLPNRTLDAPSMFILISLRELCATFKARMKRSRHHSYFSQCVCLAMLKAFSVSVVNSFRLGFVWVYNFYSHLNFKLNRATALADWRQLLSA